MYNNNSTCKCNRLQHVVLHMLWRSNPSKRTNSILDLHYHSIVFGLLVGSPVPTLRLWISGSKLIISRVCPVIECVLQTSGTISCGRWLAMRTTDFWLLTFVSSAVLRSCNTNTRRSKNSKVVSVLSLWRVLLKHCTRTWLHIHKADISDVSISS